MNILLGRLEGVAAAVLVNRVVVYHEDDDKDASNRFFPAKEVAERLGRALNCKVQTLELKYADLEIPDAAETWTFDDLSAATLKAAGGPT